MIDSWEGMDDILGILWELIKIVYNETKTSEDGCVVATLTLMFHK